MNETWEGGKIGMFLGPHTVSGSGADLEPIVSPQLYIVLNEIIAGVTLVISLSGVINNVVNIRTFALMGLDDGVTVTFLFLSVSDFVYTLVTFVQMAFTLLESYEKRHGLMLFRPDPFAVMLFAMNVGLAINVVTPLTTTYLAVVRCLCVARPLQFKAMFTRFRSTVVLVAFPVVAVVSHVPLFSHMGLTSRFVPSHNASRVVLWLSSDREKVKDVTRIIFMNYIRFTCQVIIVVCVVVMATKLRQSVQFRQSKASTGGGQSKAVGDDSGQKLTGRELSVVVQVVVICIVSTVCSLAHIFVTFLTLFDPNIDMGKPQELFYLVLSQAVIPFDCINSSVNFYIYYKFNSRFRSLCSVCEGGDGGTK